MIGPDRMFLDLERSYSRFLPGGCTVHGCPHRWERSAYSGQIKAQTGATDSFHVQAFFILVLEGEVLQKDVVWFCLFNYPWRPQIRLVSFISCRMRLRSWILSKFVFLLLVPIVRNIELTSLIPPFMVMDLLVQSWSIYTRRSVLKYEHVQSKVRCLDYEPWAPSIASFLQYQAEILDLHTGKHTESFQ